MRSTSPFLIGALACLHAATAQEVRTLEDERDGALRYGTPNYIDDSTFDAALQKPNATGSVSFTGRNVSAPYPGSDVDGWSLSVNVTSGIIKPGEDNRELTGSAISISQPDGLPTTGGNNGTDGFQVCVNVMMIVPNATSDYTQLAADDAGTCGSYLSQQCRDELADLATSTYQANGTCSYLNDPPTSCGNVTFSPAGSSSNEPAFAIPAGFYQQGWTAFTYGSDPPVASSDGDLVQEDYDEMAKIVYPVLLTYGYTNTSTPGNNTSVFSSLACVSATEFTEGSRVPESEGDGDTNAGGRVNVGLTPLGAFIALTTFAVML